MPSQLSLRSATKSDLDAMTTIGMAAFALDPQWVYRYPYADLYPEDHIKFTRERYGEWLEAAAGLDCSIMLAEIDEHEEVGKEKKVIAMAIWRTPGGAEADKPNEILRPPSAKPLRRDCSPSNMAAYREGIFLTQTRCFVLLYGFASSSQLSLAQLATHPSYFRHGAGTLLLQWGIDLATKQNIPITLSAGPMAEALYIRHGFRKKVSVSVRVDGQEEPLMITGMSWEPSGYVPRGEMEGDTFEVVYHEDSSSQSK